MAAPNNSVYMDLPEEIKLQILRNLDNKELLLTRLVCKGFVPKDLGVIITLFGNKGITVKLNLTPGVDTFTSEEIDTLRVFHWSSTVNQRQIENLPDLPVSLLEKTAVLVILLGEQQNGLHQDLDLILEHCSRIKLFYIVLVNSGLGVEERLEQIFTKNQTHFTHLAIFPVDAVEVEEELLTFDCSSLQQCSNLSRCLILGNGLGRANALTDVTNFDKIPVSVKVLGFFKAGIQDLEWAAANFVNLNTFYLEVDWASPFPGPDGQHFSRDLFKRLCNMPSLSQMELLFTVKIGDNRWGAMVDILEGIQDLCHVKEGIEADLEFPPVPKQQNDENENYEFMLAALFVSITRPPFGGFNDDDNNVELPNEDFVDDVDDLD